MAIFNFEKKDGLQRGTVGDECMHCRRNRDIENYEPKYLDGETVYKLRINGNDYCLCMDCFMKTLGEDYVLLMPGLLAEDVKEETVEEKKEPAKKQSSNKKKEEEK